MNQIAYSFPLEFRMYIDSTLRGLNNRSSYIIPAIDEWVSTSSNRHLVGSTPTGKIYLRKVMIHLKYFFANKTRNFKFTVQQQLSIKLILG